MLIKEPSYISRSSFAKGLVRELGHNDQGRRRAGVSYRWHKRDLVTKLRTSVEGFEEDWNNESVRVIIIIIRYDEDLQGEVKGELRETYHRLYVYTRHGHGTGHLGSRKRAVSRS
jgi:hypothetical protein